MTSYREKLIKEIVAHSREFSEDDYDTEEDLEDAGAFLDEYMLSHYIDDVQDVKSYDLCNCDLCRTLQHQDAARLGAKLSEERDREWSSYGQE